MTYAQVRPYARRIAVVTQLREMPPWKPEPGYGSFRDAARLADEEIETLRRWAAAGAPAGTSGTEASPPTDEGWALGKPDLVLPLPRGFELDAQSEDDVFRNFVIGLEQAGSRYVRAIDLRPADRRIVHHASILADGTGAARGLDELDREPGFPGMARGVAPGGHFFGWTPGRRASPLEEGMAWRVEPGTDLVVQLHLLPTGQPEALGGEVGLYFTDDPPSRTPVTVHLSTTTLDIPPGEASYSIDDEMVLPVDVEVSSVYPHLHYLGKEVKAYAVLPGGEIEPLLWIRNWDFNWQDEYRYERPVALPAGSRLRLELRYDNSDANPANPSSPPRRVGWGPRSRDEMGDVWLKVVPRRPEDLAMLATAVRQRDLDLTIRGFEHRLAIDPEDFEAHNRLGQVFLSLNRVRDAADSLAVAVEIQPDAWHAHHGLGVAEARLGDWPAAVDRFARSVELNPEHAAGLNNLGIGLARTGRLAEAVDAYRAALALRSELVDTRINLGSALSGLGRHDEALGELDAALRLRPGSEAAHNNLAGTYLALDRLEEAADHARRALEIRPDYVDAIKNMATVMARSGDLEGAVAHRQRAVDLQPDDPDGRYYLAVGLVELGRYGEATRQLEMTRRLDPGHAGAGELLELLAEAAAAGER